MFLWWFFLNLSNVFIINFFFFLSLMESESRYLIIPINLKAEWNLLLLRELFQMYNKKILYMSLCKAGSFCKAPHGLLADGFAHW